MAEYICADLSSRPVKTHLPYWLGAVKQLQAVGDFERARLLLDTILQAQEDSAEAYALLVHTHLQLRGDRHLLKALQIAREGVAACCHSDKVNTQEQSKCNLALAVALGSVARMTVVPQADRSQYRSEAREILQSVAEVQGSHRVPSLYALAVIDAEGGHYDHAVMHAQQALKAAEAQQQDSGAAGSFIAPVIALLGLLLSARQQVQAALSVVDAALASSGSARSAFSTTSSTDSTSLPRCYDILLMRVKAQLLLAVEDANGALAVLGSAKQKLSTAHHGMAEGPDTAAAVVVLKQQEAQVWRDLALAYASQQQPDDAQLCVQQMQQLEPHSAASYHAIGVVAAASGDRVGAKQAYKTALALNAVYAPALLSLGALLRKQGDVHDLSVAAGLLTDALRYEPHNHMGWYNLGMARKAQGHIEEGDRHLFTAVTLSAAAPVLSYSELPLSI